MSEKKSIPYITIILMAINIIIFFYMDFTGDTQDTSYLLEHGGMYVPYIVEQSQWYRMFTHMFVHSGMEHLFCNMVMLFVFGCRLEEVYGRIKYIISYIICGLGATVFSAVWDIVNCDYNVSIGASGAIMGLFGIYLVMMYKNRDINQVSVASLVVIFLIMVFGNMQQGIDWMAHFGGSVFGVIIGLILYNPKKDKYNNWF